jgi:hypothetical protein
MPEETMTRNDSLIPGEPLPGSAAIFAERVHGLLDGHPKDEVTVAKALDGMDDILDRIAAGLYNIASMMVGEGEDSIRLVETAVATADLSNSIGPVESRMNSRRALCAAALELLANRDASSLAAPKGLEHAATCIGDDELDAAGVTGEELELMLAGPERDRVRNWLESLPTEMRAIFVMRGVAGLPAGETADLLRVHGGAQTGDWSEGTVREIFRQGLCSLASQVLHAANQ